MADKVHRRIHLFTRKGDGILKRVIIVTVKYTFISVYNFLASLESLLWN